MRRNPTDRRLRELERRFKAGDPGAMAPYVIALRSLGHEGEQEAARIMRQDMISTGAWDDWPHYYNRINSINRASEENRHNFHIATESAIAVPGLIVEHVVDDDLETFYFNDGPYVIRVYQHDTHLEDRQYQGLPPGQRGFIPMWRVGTLYTPWRNLPQKAHEFLARHGRPLWDPRGDSSTGIGWIDVLTDGPVVEEQGTPNVWESETRDFLVEDVREAADRERRSLRTRLNPDVDLRKLERAAAAGDPRAQAALARARERTLPPAAIREANEFLAQLAQKPANWEELMKELVSALFHFYGPKPEPLRAFLLDQHHPGLDWVYRTHLSPRVEGLYERCLRSVVSEVGAQNHNGSNEFITLSRSRTYEVQIDFYFGSEDEDEVENAARELNSCLDSRDADLVLRHAPGLEAFSDWDQDVFSEELDEALDVTLYNAVTFDLYHLFALLGVSYDFEPKVTKKKKTRRRKKKKKKARRRR